MGMGRARHTNSERFPTRSVLGEDKRRHSEHFISCSNCPEEITANVASGGGALGDEMLTKRFTRAGWYVGRVAGSHLCPGCNRPRQRAVLTVVPAPEPEKEEPVAQPTIALARELSFADRRIINAKLEETYENEATGYRAGWDDDKVAKDLGVDAVWVAKLRSENFGPATGNEQIRAIVEDYAKVCDALKAAEQAVRVATKAVDIFQSTMLGIGIELPQRDAA